MDLVLLVCLAASPASCHEERVLMNVAEANSRLCMMGAIPALVEWTEEHPEWQVSRWKCRLDGQVRVSRNAE
ncbi:hypothetical protein GCM10008179_27730 [Hansschlegelia plantiphila]|uniref:Uncharacterized protein n=1 Tax=Hansschlegelia plantiphila TaxID=374655 RepID=A0A9W6J1L1_9HYPH|nr:hypothetical protein GCM10008179_27730 [Hansschlegelia plantiphila]